MIYADHHATTPVRPEVLEAMTRASSAGWGNPSSPHAWGERARRIVEEARRSVADLVGCSSEGIVFTSGGTEANNLVVRGVPRVRSSRNRVAVSAIEHASILEAAGDLAHAGIEIDVLPVDSHGVVIVEAARELVTEATALVSVMWVNNETGVIQPIGALAGHAHAAGAWFHTDAVQGVERLDRGPLAAADFITVSAHKLYGPMGVGALCVRASRLPASPRDRLVPLLAGGGQERGFRSGTPNVPGIAGFGVASACALREGAGRASFLAMLTDAFEQALDARLAGVEIHGARAARVPGTSAFSVPDLDAESTLAALDLEGIALSSGAACSTGSVSPSHVLAAMGVSEALARAALRVSFGRGNTEDEAQRIVEALVTHRARAAGTPHASGTR
jgi:cysteine desulfurase